MTRFDLLIVGGGISGLAVARLAARSGLRVALIDRGDLASGSSSSSSHMLHGGLRYLEHGHFALVRQALAERRMLHRMAPDVTRPARFMIPVRRGQRRPGWMLRLGLGFYDAFAGRNNLAPHSWVRAKEARAMEPDLAPEGLRGAGLYSDVVMDDARLAIAVARDAVAHGAAIEPYTELVAARPMDGSGVQVHGRGVLSGAERRFQTRLIVNASGPWADQVRTQLVRSLTPGAPDPSPLLRPSRGVHLVYPRLTRSHGILLFSRTDGRVFFVVPFGEHSLVGTTEVEVPSPVRREHFQPTVDEVRYLHQGLAQAMPAHKDLPVLAITSGLRPLLAASGGVGEASREHRVVEEGPVLTLAGGKYTTFRVMARDLVARALARLGRAEHAIRESDQALPRALDAGASPEAVTEHALQHEFACRLEDVMRRRSSLWLRPDRGRMVAPAVAAQMAKHLGWNETRKQEELDSYEAGLEQEERVLRRALGSESP